MSGHEHTNGGPEAKRAKVGPDAKDVIGWHNMYWAKGQLKVCFRPGGKFFCQNNEYAEKSTWQILDGEVLIDWGKYGRYVLLPDEGKHLKGHALPKDGKENWRKTLYNSGLTPVEELLFGEGEGTEWDIKSPEGDYVVQFKCDGYNHVVCKTHKGHVDWSLDKKGKTISINWGEGNKTELDIDVKKKTMDGYYIRKGVEDPDEDKDSRTATFKRILHKHGHGHGHGHGHEAGHGGHGHEGHGGHEGHSGGHSHGHSHGDGHAHSHGDAHGGDHDHGIVGLGNLTIGSDKFMVDREGQVDKGFETEFGFERVVPAEKLEGYTAWVQDSKGEPLCDPVKGKGHDGHLHFKMTPKKADAAKLAVKYNDQVSAISLHPGATPTNDGIMAVLEDAGGKHVGFIELKLHDDAGDLELWISKDGEEPFDISPDTTITATFATMDNKSVKLNVRNNDKNEDEDGNPNMRDGKTNYFVFPGESDQDPEFLVGEKFRSTTTVTFTSESKTYTAPPFILVPHQH